MNTKEIRKEEAKKTLKRIIKPTSTLLIIIKSVSSSGMSRRMDVYLKDKNITYLTGYIADLLGQKYNEKGVSIQGCGMDMAFALADQITYKLFGNKRLKSFNGNDGSCLNWKVL